MGPEEGNLELPEATVWLENGATIFYDPLLMVGVCKEAGGAKLISKGA